MNTVLQRSKETVSAKAWRYEPWLIRFILLAPALVFTVVSVRFLADPAGAATASGFTPDSALGLTNVRSGIGGLFLAAACITFFCLLSPRRFLIGLGFLAILLSVILGVRLVSVVVDGTASASLPVLCAEAVFLLLAVAGIFLERQQQLRNPGARQRHDQDGVAVSIGS
jgi:hypothetical protein